MPQSEFRESTGYPHPCCTATLIAGGDDTDCGKREVPLAQKRPHVFLKDAVEGTNASDKHDDVGNDASTNGVLPAALQRAEVGFASHSFLNLHIRKQQPRQNPSHYGTYARE